MDFQNFQALEGGGDSRTFKNFQRGVGTMVYKHTSLSVMHPVEHDLWRTIPPCSHIAGHFVLCVSRQTKVQYLQRRLYSTQTT